MKKCSKCGELKELSKFTPSTRYTSGYSSQCKQCGKEYSRAIRADPERRKRDRNKWLKDRYGITLTEYEEISDEQGNRCGICGNKPGKYPLNVDHEHKSGYIRGLLCQRCNRGLGLIGDNLVRAELAVEYLRKFELSKESRQETLRMVPRIR